MKLTNFSSFHFQDLACIVSVSQHHIVLHCILLFFGTAEVSCHCIGTCSGIPRPRMYEFYPNKASNLILACSRPSVRRNRWLLRLTNPSGPRPARGCAPAHPVARTMTVPAMSDPRFQV